MVRTTGKTLKALPTPEALGIDHSVGVLLPTAPTTASTFFGLAAYGHPAAMLNFLAGSASVRSACEMSRVRLIVTSRKFVNKAAKNLQPLLDALEPDYPVVYLEDIRALMTLGDDLFAMAMERWPDRVMPCVGNVDDPVAILYTSGSEGAPKGVVHSHRALISNPNQVASVIDTSTRDKVFNCLPMFHAFGLTGATLLPLFYGVPIYMFPDPQSRMVPKMFDLSDSTIIFGTNALFAHWAKTSKPGYFKRCRLGIAGAERLDPQVSEFWTKQNRVILLEGYGTTETAPVIAVNTPSKFLHGTVGQPLPGIELDIVPEAGFDADGRLRVRGPNVMMGYLFADNPGVIVPPEDGWHDTKDLVKIVDGHIRIVGRLSRFANISGEKVPLDTAERLAAKIDPLARHATTTMPDVRRGERIVLLTTSEQVTRAAIAEIARSDGAPENALPKDILLVNDVPLLGTGKVNYPGVLRLVQSLQGASAANDTETDTEEVA